MKIALISDTHNKCLDSFVPDADLLIHAGDLTMGGDLMELNTALAWLESMPHPHKVVIAGNHDFGLQRPSTKQAMLERFKSSGICYLEDSEVVIEGLRIWGSPWQPEFHDWAFNLPRGKALREKWDLIPEGIDALVTHGPPKDYGDRTLEGSNVGCEELLAAIDRVRPRLHVFGHIHEGRGLYGRNQTTLVNASMLDRRYRPVHSGILIDSEVL